MEQFYQKYRSKLEDLAWLSQLVSKPVTNVVVSTPAEAGGHYAEIFSLDLTIDPKDNTSDSAQPEHMKLLVKLLAKGHLMQGFEREIPVYQNFVAPLVDKGLINAPRFFFGDAEVETGAKIVILEELDAVHCGRFFGTTSPHNRGKDLDALCADFPDITDVEITRRAFIQVAQLHGAYWNLPKEEIPAYIRGCDWIGADAASSNGTSVGEKQYNAMVGFARDQWAMRHEKRPKCRFNPYLENIVTHSLATTTYASFLTALNSSPHTVIHSDFYPANALLEVADKDSRKEQKLILIDFEVIGVGQGAQDLAQWMISHVHPETRLANESELLDTYRDALYKAWVENRGAKKAAEFEKEYSREQLLQDYIAGGGKWIWLIAVCVSSIETIPDVLYQHFIDQLTHFFTTFDVQIEKGNVPGPRS